MKSRFLSARFVTLLVVLSAIVFGVFWAWQQAFIEVRLDDSEQGSLQVFIKNQKTGAVKELESDPPVKIRVSRGTHEVLVTAGDNSYFSVVSAKNWFGTTAVSAQLTSEHGRQFVGNGPDDCMDFSGALLLSYPCSGPFKDLKAHLPATADSPSTFTKDIGSGIVGDIEGLIESPNGLLALVQMPNTARSYGNHALYEVDRTAGKPSGVVPQRNLTELDPKIAFKAGRYGNGFVVYDDTLGHFNYFDSFGPATKPQAISAYKPNDTSLTMAHVSVTDKNIAVLFTNSTDDKPAIKSELAVGNHQTAEHYDFDKPYTSGALCKPNVLCMLNNDRLDLYRIEQNAATYLYSLSDVKTVMPSSTSLLIGRSKEVLNFDVETKTGYRSYALDEYDFESMSLAKTGYVIKISTPNDDQTALYVSADTVNDHIDKALLELSEREFIKNVSVYGNIIFISPNVGELVYDAASDSFMYDKTIRSQVAKQVSEAVGQAGIDTSKYTVINTLP